MASESKREPVGLVGTGLFGTALADRLLAGGYPVSVHNRTREKADPLLARGATWSDNPLNECRRIIFCLFTTEQVAQVLDAMSAELNRNKSSSIPARAIHSKRLSWASDWPAEASNISKRLSPAQANKLAITNPRHWSPVHKRHSKIAATCGIAWRRQRFTSAPGETRPR